LPRRGCVTDMRFLVLTFQAPAMSFSGPVIDGAGNTARLPKLSAICGLIANAIGLDRADVADLEELQRQIVFAAREERAGQEMMDFQTAKLSISDKGWTYNGVERRSGGPDTYLSPTILRRPFLADHMVTVVLGLTEGKFSIDQVVDALDRPARPIFLGRKSFLPSGPILNRSRDIFVDAENALEALLSVTRLEGGDSPMHAIWPADCHGDGRMVDVYDIRDFASNRHSGMRKQNEGRISVISS